jgi:hypothetical protein
MLLVLDVQDTNRVLTQWAVTPRKPLAFPFDVHASVVMQTYFVRRILFDISFCISEYLSSIRRVSVLLEGTFSPGFKPETNEPQINNDIHICNDHAHILRVDLFT